MQILKATLGNFRNEEHFQFQTEFKGLVEQYTPETLNIEAAWILFLSAYNQEAGALNVVQKSTVTEAIAETDQWRDGLFMGLYYTVKGAIYHLDRKSKGCRTDKNSTRLFWKH
ncbi:hypothetical protein ADUPG1_003310 [Aduncisulcus paluster]|uniref:Uncharacterized protein n=1 Tax=Aduncisulcus paluster TaxID=2918883 RepID=A0ABQ5KY55_9EUKA|nr:hypothetical protein ADUPG1_003310 [Aduncisulcus paluster]